MFIAPLIFAVPACSAGGSPSWNIDIPAFYFQSRLSITNGFIPLVEKRSGTPGKKKRSPVRPMEPNPIPPVLW